MDRLAFFFLLVFLTQESLGQSTQRHARELTPVKGASPEWTIQGSAGVGLFGPVSFQKLATAPGTLTYIDDPVLYSFIVYTDINHEIPGGAYFFRPFTRLFPTLVDHTDGKYDNDKEVFTRESTLSAVDWGLGAGFRFREGSPSKTWFPFALVALENSQIQLKGTESRPGTPNKDYLLRSTLYVISLEPGVRILPRWGFLRAGGEVSVVIPLWRAQSEQSSGAIADNAADALQHSARGGAAIALTIGN